jgi:hypothetical protein
MKKIINALYHLSDSNQTGKFMMAISVLTAALMAFLVAIAFFTATDGVHSLEGTIALLASIVWGWFSKYLFSEIDWSAQTT